MNCPSCGSPLQEGAGVCNVCGNPVNMQYQQPGMNPNAQYQQGYDPNMQYQQQGYDPNMQYQQQGYDPNMQYQQQYDPNMQYQQPGMDPNAQFQTQTFGRPASNVSFIDAIKAEPIRICAYVGFLFTFLASFFPRWVYAKVSFLGVSKSEGAGLFAADGGILKLYGILFLLFSICGILIEFGSNIPAINSITDKYKQLPFSQFYIPALFLILWILAITNSLFRMVVKMDVDSSYGSAGYGLMTWLCLIGILLLLVRPVLALVKKEPYWK